MPPTTENAGGSPASTSGSTVTSGTASESLIKAASSAAEPTTSTPPVAKAGDTATPSGVAAPAPTAPATGETGTPGSTAQPAVTGQAPEPRIVAATRNARSQVLTDVSRALGFDRPLTRNDYRDLQTGHQLLAELRADPAGFYAELGGRLGRASGPATAKTFEFPEASLSSADGRKAYSAEDVQKIMAIQEEKILSRMQGELKPVLDWRKSAASREVDAQAEAGARTLATNALTEARTELPHFKEMEPDIVRVMENIQQRNPDLIEQIGPIATLYRAYNFVLKHKVFPTINSGAEQRVREENARKAAGSSLVTPGGGGAAPASKPQLRDGDVNSLAKHMERLAAGTAASL